jgi:lipopolysaccharide cholinephosphotransferase
MRELTLPEIKEIELEILKTFHNFCKENNIRYFISHGTLLGTIRYKGFIPWDDDVDVLVPREDYDKLLSIFKDSEQYRLLHFEKDERFLFPYAKLCDMTTLKIENGLEDELKLGLDMDIFPLDAWADDRKKAKKEVKQQKRALMCLGLTKLDKPDSLNLFKRIVKAILMVFCKMVGSKHYVRKLMKNAKKHPYEGAKYLGGKAWNVYGYRDVIPAEAFDHPIEVEFEGETFWAPVGYDAFLSSLYGNYLPEPPLEKRKTHHNFKAYKL